MAPPAVSVLKYIVMMDMFDNQVKADAITAAIPAQEASYIKNTSTAFKYPAIQFYSTIFTLTGKKTKCSCSTTGGSLAAWAAISFYSLPVNAS